MLRLCVLLVCFAATGCRMIFPAPTTMASRFDPLPGPAKAKCLVVLLPGIADNAQTFREKGFVAAIQHSGASADVVSANATVGYYLDGTASLRLEADVIAPLRSRPYEQIWLVGVSIGGLGTLQYTRLFPEHVDGIFAMAPFLKNALMNHEINKAGGLEKWTPDPPAPVTQRNADRQLWSWLHEVVTGKEKRPVIYVGYADHDGLIGQSSVLAAALPPDRVLRVPGVHDWPSWRAMLDQFLQSSDFQRRCGVADLPLAGPLE
jgi:pimeloyl-ACP methyl ester carboxylesterase